MFEAAAGLLILRRLWNGRLVLLRVMQAVIGENKRDRSLTLCCSVAEQFPLKIDQVFLLIVIEAGRLLFCTTTASTT